MDKYFSFLPSKEWYTCLRWVVLLEDNSPDHFMTAFNALILLVVFQSCPALCNPMDWKECQASLSFTISQSLLRLMPIESVMPSNHLILCHHLLLLPLIFPSIRVFSNESVLHIRWPKYWSFSFSNSLSNKYSGLISFRIDWFDLLAVQRTLKSLLQHYNSKVSVPGAPNSGTLTLVDHSG